MRIETITIVWTSLGGRVVDSVSTQGSEVGPQVLCGWDESERRYDAFAGTSMSSVALASSPPAPVARHPDTRCSWDLWVARSPDRNALMAHLGLSDRDVDRVIAAVRDVTEVTAAASRSVPPGADPATG